MKRQRSYSGDEFMRIYKRLCVKAHVNPEALIDLYGKRAAAFEVLYRKTQKESDEAKLELRQAEARLRLMKEESAKAYEKAMEELLDLNDPQPFVVIEGSLTRFCRQVLETDAEVKWSKQFKLQEEASNAFCAWTMFTNDWIDCKKGWYQS